MNSPTPENPRPKAASPELSSAAGRERPTTSASTPGILVVDDETIILHYLDEVLRGIGFNVFLAASGTEAAAVFRANRQSIVLALIDVYMPKTDGPATLELLRQIDPALCCCFITGGGSDYSIDELFARGATMVFQKPELQHLARALRHLVFGPSMHAEIPPTQFPPNTSDRRRFPRWSGTPQEVAVAFEQRPGLMSSATVINRSLNGLCMISDIAVEPGASLQVRSTATSREKWLTLEVRHQRPEGRRWRLGCRFVDPPAISVLTVYGWPAK